ncbi:YncE family protein [Acidiphilium sp.]|uniref:YncE family protein n=1 Tax=Acidiphilium sp. TaxID=527 RepID=UPI003CFFE20A
MTRFPRLALAALIALLPGIAAAAPPFALSASIPIAGPVKWDYLTTEPGTNRLFAAEGNRVAVINTATGTLISTIAPIDGAHGIALAPRLARGFATAGIAGTVTMFSLKTLKPIKTINVGPGPDAIAYDPSTQRIFVPNEKSQTLFAIDGFTGKIIRRIPFHADPEFIVVNGRGRAYLNLKSANQIAVVNTRTLTITRRINLTPSCQGPTGLAIDRTRNRLFVSCRNHSVDVVNDRNGRILATLPIPAFCDAMRYDPRYNIAFAPSIDGTLTIIGAAGRHGYKIVQTLKTAPSARTMAFDQATQTAYLSAATIMKILPPAPGKSHGKMEFVPGSFHILVVKAGKS